MSDRGRAPSSKRAFRALRFRDFRLIAIGNLVSQLGFWGQYVAVGWEAQRLTNSDFLITLSFAVQWIPALLLGPVAGVLADRYDRRRLVLYGNLAMVAPPLAIALLIQTGHISLTSLIVLVLVGGMGQAFTQPATNAFIPALVPAEDLHSAIALNAGMVSSTRVIGPTIAGAMIAAWGVAWGFHINAVSFLAVSAACRMVKVRPGPANTTRTSVRTELALGISYTRRNPAVARLVILIWIQGVWFMHAALMPIIAKRVLHGGPSTYGLLAAAPGIGFVGAALVVTLMVTDGQRRGALTVGCFGLSLSLLTLGLSHVLPLSVAALGLFGLSYMTVNTLVTTMLIAASEESYRGRVMGVLVMCTAGMNPFNSVAGGVLASFLGASGTVVLCGIGSLAFNVIFFSTNSMKVIKAGTKPQFHRADAVPAVVDAH